MSDFKGEREQGALEGVTKEYFELQPVAFSLLLAAAAPALGVDGVSCWKLLHRVEPLTRGSRGRRCGAC